jgi:hypothetical protein
MAEEVEYRQLPGVNQSSLKKILVSPQSYLQAVKNQAEPDDDKEDHFVFGGVLDVMLVGNKEEFDRQYVKIPDDTKCSDTIKSIISTVYNSLTVEEKLPLSNYSDTILSVARQQGYQDKYKDDTLIATVIKQGEDYFKLLSKIAGKTPVTETDYAKAVSCKMALIADKFTNPYVKAGKEIEFLNRFVIQFEYEGVNIKGELDRVIINHKQKTVTPLDFKSTGKSVYTFKYDFFKYRYDFQAAVYRQGLFNDERIKTLLEEGYTITPFVFVVVEKDLKNNPMVFVVSPEVESIGLVGGVTSEGKELEGFTQAMQRYKYHEENNLWDYPAEYYLNEGYLLITP